MPSSGYMPNTWFWKCFLVFSRRFEELKGLDEYNFNGEKTVNRSDMSLPLEGIPKLRQHMGG
ncbi:hypothetical protein KC19_7G059100 [Ceratodon purpureus]|uniref:Uncharacterized protein n=1 Tax=Ceratodon purpureus TaxID=3225 RepID=A0A8T0H7N1_CERPU|nr:hypothetical protein KC19_7G059100 [Ceratodon purpureus]